jgi:CBS domain-containing protein
VAGWRGLDAVASMARVRAGEIMTAPVVTVSSETPTREIAETLGRRRISAVPVVDEAGSVVGLVSEYDLLAKSGLIARDLMTTAVISVTEDTDIADVRHLLVDRRIRRVPVLAGGRLVGIVSRSDVVTLMATEWVCQVCGEPVRGESTPDQCPKCLGGSDGFVLQEQPIGAVCWRRYARNEGRVRQCPARPRLRRPPLELPAHCQATSHWMYCAVTTGRWR